MNGQFTMQLPTSTVSSSTVLSTGFSATGFVETPIARAVSPDGSPLESLGARAGGEEEVRVLVMGSPRAVENTIRVLYLRGFAELYEWSPLQPAQRPGEVMSLLRRRLVLG